MIIYATDAQGLSADPLAVSIQVNDVNDPPVFNSPLDLIILPVDTTTAIVDAGEADDIDGNLAYVEYTISYSNPDEEVVLFLPENTEGTGNNTTSVTITGINGEHNQDAIIEALSEGIGISTQSGYRGFIDLAVYAYDDGVASNYGEIAVCIGCG